MSDTDARATQGGATDGATAGDDAVEEVGEDADGDDTGSGGDNGDDATGDGGQSEQCVAMPAQWSGPARLVQGDAALPCDGDFPNPFLVAGRDLLAPPADCACTCGDAVDFACGAAGAHYRAASGGQCVDPAIAGGSTYGGYGCHLLGPNVHPGYGFRADSVQPFSPAGSCVASLVPTIEPPTWGVTATLCEAAPADGACTGDEVHVPATDQGQICVVRPGAFDCSDAGPFTAPAPALFDSYTDTRDCGSCACGDPVGSCDIWSVTMVGDGGPGQCDLDNTQTVPIMAPTACFTVEIEAEYVIMSFAPPSEPPTCVPSLPDPVGDAASIDPISVCCLP